MFVRGRPLASVAEVVADRYVPCAIVRHQVKHGKGGYLDYSPCRVRIWDYCRACTFASFQDNERLSIPPLELQPIHHSQHR